MVAADLRGFGHLLFALGALQYGLQLHLEEVPHDVAAPAPHEALPPLSE